MPTWRKKILINNLTLKLQELEKEWKTNSNVSRSKQITKIKSNIYEIEPRKDEWDQVLVFKKIHKIDISLFRLRRKKFQINRTKNERTEITNDTTETKENRRNYY
jgi:hypothetical protein